MLLEKRGGDGPRSSRTATVWGPSRSAISACEGGGGHAGKEGTHEAHFAGVHERLGGEPFPHERAGRAVVHGVDEPADVVVH